MVTVQRSVLVHRDPAAVFALLADVDRYPHFLRGFTRWEPVGDEPTGVGARFRVLMQVGSIEAGSVLRTIAWEEPRTIAWRSERGIDHRGRWLVEPRASGSQLTMEISFELEGPVRWVVERLTARIVDRNVQATLLAARRLLERPQAPPSST
jgi:ribosome-associated toxin RatA of RatAB toxin-antitoxin module